jgi:hypothetical protein
VLPPFEWIVRTDRHRLLPYQHPRRGVRNGTRNPNNFTGSRGPFEKWMLSGRSATAGVAVGKKLTQDGIYKLVRHNSALLGFEIGMHGLRATAATNALDHQADIAKSTSCQYRDNASFTTAERSDPRTVRLLKCHTQEPDLNRLRRGICEIEQWTL